MKIVRPLNGARAASAIPGAAACGAFRYSAARDPGENKAFVKAFGGDWRRPGFMAAVRHDGAGPIVEAVKELDGRIDG